MSLNPFQNWSIEDVRKFNERTNRNRGGGAASPQLQEPEASHKKRRLDNRAENKNTDGRAGERYFVRVIFRVSDNRKRDAFGMLETVADCLVRAVRRFNSGDAGRSLVDATGAARGGRCED